MSKPLPTIFVVHPKERRSKCTVEWLRGRPDFEFRQFPCAPPDPALGYVRLGLGGRQLTRDDASAGLLILDGTWRLAERMEPDFAHLPVVSLGPWQTAYPRVSKLFDDPRTGLATVEALFAAWTQMGRSTEGLLDRYLWKSEFLELNAHLIDRADDTTCRSGGVTPASKSL